MNKKTSIFYIVTVAVAIICLILDLIFSDLEFSFLGICFAITMVVYGFALIIRGFHFKIDSSLFLGIVILGFGVVSILTYFTSYGYLDLWHYILLSASLASFITGIYFKSSMQKKWAWMFIGLFALGFMFQLDWFNVWIMLGLMLAWMIGFIVVNNIIISRRK